MFGREDSINFVDSYTLFSLISNKQISGNRHIVSLVDIPIVTIVGGKDLEMVVVAVVMVEEVVLGG